MTSSVLEELPISNIKMSPAPGTKESDFEFSAPSGTSTMEYSITAEKGAILASLTIEGTYTSYQLFVADQDGKKVGPIENLSGEDTFESDSHDFNRNITEMHTITIIITGPSTGFVVNITQFDICLPEFKFCRLTQDDVLKSLKYLPLSGVLGTSADDGEEVNYGLNMAQGDVLEEGTIVKGHCYECECNNYTLVCRVIESCICPNYTTRCEGTCDKPTLVVEFDADGVDPSCYPNDTCTPEGCTTPYECPSSWGEWSECSDCMRTRQRSCDENCGEVCDSVTLSQTDVCDECTTTTPTTMTTMTTVMPPTTEFCDGDNEVYKCYNHFVRCNDTCRTLYNEDACTNLKNVDEDMPCNYSCGCKDGYKKNAAGHCVKEEECECYNGTIALPVNYKENVSECKICECKINVGYVCTEKPNCCETEEWSEWSECNVECGSGVMTRTRKSKTGNCDTTDLTETKTCFVPSNTTNDECRTCKCEDNKITCTPKNNTTPWKPTCDTKCYCSAETGEKVCLNAPPQCKEQPTVATCKNETHEIVQDPTDPCCKICKSKVPLCARKTIDNKVLNFTHATYGECVSPVLDVGRCEGSCGISQSGGNHYKYKLPGQELPIFDLDYFQNCECCQAQLAAVEVAFKCANTEELIKIKVTQIDSCKCMQCT